MTTRMYLVECYEPGIERNQAELAGQRAQASISELQARGVLIEYMGALLVLEDEIAFSSSKPSPKIPFVKRPNYRESTTSASWSSFRSALMRTQSLHPEQNKFLPEGRRRDV